MNKNDKKVVRWEDIPKAKISKFSQKTNITEEFSEQSNNMDLGFKKVENKYIRILENIYNTNLKKVEKNIQRSPHKNLYEIVCDKEILRLAYRKLSKNKGAMTPGAENITATDINDQFLENLSIELKLEKFKWNPAKRIYVEKPGKKKKRSLGINDFKNKLVQEALRMILESIYEPEFRKYETNSGFRPKRDCAKAIEGIKVKAQFANLVIEGDIVGAYDNVNHNILFNIIKKRIRDNKLLKLIYKGFKAGIIEEKTYIDTNLGIPQGGVCSPILFNIYMHEFDKYIINVLQNTITQEDINANKSRTMQETPEYRKLRKTITKLKNEILIEKNHNTIEKKDIRTLITTIIDNINIFKESIWSNIISRGEKFVNKKRTQKNSKPNAEIIQIKSEIEKFSNQFQKKILINYIIDKLGEELKIISLKYKSTNRSSIEKSKILMYYHRYADDWTLWLRCTMEYALNLRNKIKYFLKDKLVLELSDEKTKITLLEKNKVNFLGFSIYKNINKRKLCKTKNNDEIKISKNLASKIKVDIDRKRVDDRFNQRGFYKLIKYYDQPNNFKPREIGWLAVFEIQQIIEKFNQFMLGFGNYYITVINEPSRICKYIYILYYSCILTLCCKLKISSKELTNRYGYYDISDKKDPNYKLSNIDKPEKYYHTDIRICHKFKYDNKSKWIVLLNYKEIMTMLLKYRKKFITCFNSNFEDFTTPNIDYFSMYKINFRTRYKMTSHCIICGSTEKPLHNHHIKKLGSKKNERIKGYKNFDKLVASLNRKQITICKSCHCKIHNGTYSGLKLTDLYDVRLAIPENYILLNQENDFSEDRKLMQDIKTNKEAKFFINESNRTYWNRNYNEYLIKNFKTFKRRVRKSK